MKTLAIEEILLDLENGLTRKKSSIGYEPGIGCIMDKYELTGREIDDLFKHPSLKGKKTKAVPQLNIVNTIEEKLLILNAENNHAAVIEQPIDLSTVSNEEENNEEETNELTIEVPETEITSEVETVEENNEERNVLS